MVKDMNRMEELNLLFSDITLHSDFCPDENFYKSFFNNAIESVFSDSWSSRDKLKAGFVNQDVFPFIWNTNKDRRHILVNEIWSSNSVLPRPVKRGLAIIISAEMERIFDYGSEDDYYSGFKRDCIDYRIRFAHLVSSEFDYLYEINKLDPEDSSGLAKIWLNAGRRYSKDKELYEYWWKSIKRRPGASNEKLEVISNMSSNNVYSDDILAEVSKRGTKKIKRAMVSNMSRDINEIRWDIKKIKTELGKDPENDLLKIKLSKEQEKFDKIESALMLFADCDDREVISDMIDAVSKDNLTWLIPAASNHYYLSRRIESKIAQKSNENGDLS